MSHILRVPATIVVPGPIIQLGENSIPVTGFCIGPNGLLFFDGTEIGCIVGLENIRVNSERHTDYSQKPPKTTYTVMNTQIDCILYFEKLI